MAHVFREGENGVAGGRSIAIVGGGLAGVGAAMLLKRAGYENATVFEKADRVGGVWHHNTYPGAACDVPSHLYEFSFAPNPHWSRRFAPQAEIQAYLEGIAFFRQQKEKTIASLQKEFRLTDRTEVEGMYVKLLKVVPAKPRFPSKGIETVLDDLKARNPNAARMDPNLFYESGIIKKLEAQGFINDLYQ